MDYKNKRRKRRALRHLLLEAQGGRCGICGELIEHDPGLFMGMRAGPSRDHVIPKAKGGKDADNLVIAHYLCNCRKGDRTPTGCELIWLDAANAGLKILRSAR